MHTRVSPGLQGAATAWPIVCSILDMKELSGKTVLALHGMHLMLRENKPVSLRELGHSGSFPLSQVRSVVRKLQAAGMVRSSSRHGFVLARAAGEINVLDVVRAVDSPKPPAAPCGGDYDACESRATCILAPLCREAEQAYLDSLRRFTVADLADVSVDLPNCLDPKVRTLRESP